IHLLSRVRNCDLFCPLPVLKFCPNETGFNDVCYATLLDDDRVELEAVVDRRKNCLPIDEIEQPFPAAPVQHEPPQIARAVVRVESRWNNEAEPPAWSK